jgi:hypothetical protein
LPIHESLDNNRIKYNPEFEMRNFAEFFAHYSIEGNDTESFQFKIGSGEDYIFPQMNVIHSYNGLRKYTIQFGWFRMICSNGLVVPLSETKEFNLAITGRHTEKIQKSLESLNEKIQFFVNNAPLIIKPFQMLSDRWVTKWEDRIVEVLAANAMPVIENQNFNTLNHIKNIIESEKAQVYDPKENRVSDWLIYNGINQYINKNDRNGASPDINMAKDTKVLTWLVNNEPKENKKVSMVVN